MQYHKAMQFQDTHMNAGSAAKKVQQKKQVHHKLVDKCSAFCWTKKFGITCNAVYGTHKIHISVTKMSVHTETCKFNKNKNIHICILYELFI